ncbi:MAG: hypothetical protein FWD73_00290 [Polyangiaceae bacterium]|nr:hypothetical protein [Polyangiaceae bacterium]
MNARNAARLLAFGSLLLACGSGLAGAKADFNKGRYPEAQKELLALEPRAAHWSNSKRAEYALYRGLVHHALGDRASADVWLKEAKSIEDRKPHSLSVDDKVRLDLNLEATAHDAAPAAP